MEPTGIPPLTPRHPRVFISQLKARISLLIWLAAIALAVFAYHHGGQFGGMTGTVITYFDHAAPQETGRLKTLSVQIGDPVTAGTLLAQMDTSLLEAEKAVLVAQSVAQQGELAALTKESRRLDLLLEQRLIREQDAAELRVKQSTLQASCETNASAIASSIRLLELKITNCTLRAQADGVVSRIYHSAGTVVQAGDPVVSVVLSGRTAVVGFLSEYNARDVRVGAEAYLVPVSGYGSVFRAKVVALTPEIFSLPGRVNPAPSLQYRGRRVLLEPEAEANLLPGEEVEIFFRQPWTFQFFGNLLKQKVSPGGNP